VPLINLSESHAAVCDRRQLFTLTEGRMTFPLVHTFSMNLLFRCAHLACRYDFQTLWFGLQDRTSMIGGTGGGATGASGARGAGDVL